MDGAKYVVITEENPLETEKGGKFTSQQDENLKYKARRTMEWPLDQSILCQNWPVQV